MSIPEQEAGDCALMNSPVLLEELVSGKSVPKTVALQLCDLTTETRCSKRQTTTVREKVSDEHLHIYSACSVTLTNKDASIRHSTIWQTAEELRMWLTAAHAARLGCGLRTFIRTLHSRIFTHSST